MADSSLDANAMPAFDTQIIAHADLDPNLRTQILALCTDAYEEDFGFELSLLSRATHVLLRRDGELVAHTAWVTRELRAANLAAPLRAAYVEAVAAPTALQGQGLGSRVLAALPPLLGDVDIAALSPSEPAFYRRQGWASWRGPLAYRHDGRLIATPDEDVMILRLPRTPATLDLDAALDTDWRPGDVW